MRRTAGGGARGLPAPLRALAVIRIGLLAGVLAFGAVAWLAHRQPGWEQPESAVIVRVHRVVLMSWIAVSAILIVLRLRLERARDDAARRVTLIIAWAVSEAAALGGAVDFYLGGDASMFAGGLFVMAAAFILFPLRRPG
ncbi:MAG TPA: hypothetical protein VFS05_03745 [Gemmatimonadaceae bacterium]|nr:hypothetical protein [Gemmatimonadaceae bacterium]